VHLLGAAYHALWAEENRTPPDFGE
jgi:hypothetical protein